MEDVFGMLRTRIATMLYDMISEKVKLWRENQLQPTVWKLDGWRDDSDFFFSIPVTVRLAVNSEVVLGSVEPGVINYYCFVL